jgi:hypothetical protein
LPSASRGNWSARWSWRGAQQRQHVGRRVAVSGQPFQLALRDLERFQPRPELGLVLALALVFGVARQSQPAHDRPQHDTLADERDNNDAEGDEQNKIAVRERGAGAGGQRNGERGGERDDAAHTGEAEHEQELP